GDSGVEIEFKKVVGVSSLREDSELRKDEAHEKSGRGPLIKEIRRIVTRREGGSYRSINSTSCRYVFMSEIEIRKAVKERYSKIAVSSEADCCGAGECDADSGIISLDGSVPAEASSVNA